MIKCLSFLCLVLPCLTFGQINISGSIINQTDTHPVASASVFLNNTTNGTKTAEDGTFTLTNILPGKYDLVVSAIGFDPSNQMITVGNNNIALPVIALFPKTIALNQVTVKARRSSPERQRYLDKFTAEFLGSTELAKDCKILNTELLDFKFNADSNKLRASSVDFLVIENKALGYKVQYLLNSFLLDNSQFGMKALDYYGYALFEKLSGTPQQEKEWQKRRSDIYKGSQMHFLRSAITNSVSAEGFRVLRLPINSNNDADTVIYVDRKIYDNSNTQQSVPIIAGPDSNGLFTLLNNHDRLYISYNKYHHFTNSRYTRLNAAGNTLVDFTATKPLFDGNGVLTDPHSLLLAGAWTKPGVAGLLPVDYESDDIRNTYKATPQINKIVNALKAFADTQKFERAYLHFDKPYYGAGDTIYFAAYVLSDVTQQLTTLSGILHIDLVSPVGKITKSTQLQMKGGLAWGDFALADTLKSGNYHVRAYTNLMRNSNDNSFFEQTIPVGSPGSQRIPEGARTGEKNLEPNVAAKNKFDIQFMPEGGSLVAGNYSKIAFKATDSKGRGVDVKGTVTEEGGNEVCTFASSHLGMGVFNIVVHEGVTYKINVSYADGASAIIDLPKPVNQGYTMNLNNSNADTIRLRITGSSNSKMDNLKLVAQARGIVYYIAESTLGARFFSAVIPKNKFPTGIIQFTLFSQNGEPLNERIAFINHHDQLRLDLTTYKQNHVTRQKTKVQLIAKNKEGKPTPGNFSVAVIDEEKAPVDTIAENNILSNLLLTPELKGAIEQPNYYLRNDEKAETDLDNLMLTQGYRHFEWKKILNDSAVSILYQPEKTLQIAGTVKKSGKPLANAKVSLFSKSGSAMLIDTVTDNAGRFTFKNLAFADSTKFVIQAKVLKGQDDVTVELNTAENPQSQAKYTDNPNQSNFSSSMSNYLKNQKQFYDELQKYGINKHDIMLKEVHVEGKKQASVPHSENLNGSGQADQVVTLKQLEKLPCSRIVDCLQSVIPFVRISNDGSVQNMRYRGKMAIIIDGTYVEDDIFANLHVDDIEGIEVLMGAHYGSIYGERMANGGLIITTKRAKKQNNYYRYAPGVVTYMPKGFYKAREFYSPQYDNPHTNQKMTDLRSTIYWNPNIITDKDGKASFEYFNADGKGTYRVVVEGIDADGNLGRQVFRYKVE